jgi:DHA2 family multidrug resistance protein
VGAVLFGSTVLIPQFEQLWLGYTAERAGETLSIGGLFILPLMPLVGWLVTRIPARWLVVFGFAVSALALYVMGRINLDVDFSTLAWWRVLQASGIAFLFIPITTTSYVGLPPTKNEEGSALLNLSRNLGGSFGISVLESLLARRSQLHQGTLVQHTSRFDPTMRALVARVGEAAVRHGAGAVASTRMAYGTIYRSVVAQASALAYVDVFRLLALMALCACAIAIPLRSHVPGEAARAP